MSVASRRLWTIVPALLGTGCGLLDPSNPKEPVPRDHSENLGGAWHRTGAHEPYLAPTSCYTFQCHHVNLRGGWSLASGFDGGDPTPTYAPSCYQCHERNWTVRWPPILRVLYPLSSVVWRHGKPRAVEWWGPPADSAAVYLYRENTVLDTLLTRTPADGVIRLSAIPESWGTGDDFRIAVEDSDGRFALGQRFQICGPDPAVEVSYPTSGTVFAQGGDIRVEWQCAEGVVVDIFIYDGPDRIDVFRHGAGNSGFAARPVPPDWGTGDRYRLEVVDEKGVSGFSESFEIESAVALGSPAFSLSHR